MIKQEERQVEPILRAEKLTKRFGELTANREIDIEIHAGEIHAIAGENGAGKSTLMKMLYGVYQPTAGNLYIDGEKMERWNPTIAREKGCMFMNISRTARMGSGCSSCSIQMKT